MPETEKEQALQRLTKLVVEHFERNGYDHAHRDFQGETFYTDIVRLIESSDPAHKNDAEELATEAVADTLAEEITRYEGEVARWREQYDYRIAVIDPAVTFLTDLEKFDFLRTGPTADDLSSAIGTLKRDAATLRRNLAELERLEADLRTAADSNADGAPAVEERRHAIRGVIRHVKKLMDAIVQASNDMQSVSTTVRQLIKSEATKAYFEAHPTEGMQVLAVCDKAAKFGIGVASAATLPGWAWVVGLVDTLRSAGVHAAHEGLKTTAAREYESEHAAGAVFDEHTKDPTMMASALHRMVSANVDTVLSALGIVGQNIPGFTVIRTGFSMVVDAWLKEQLRLAVDEMKKLKPSEGGIGGQITAILEEMRESAGEAIGDKLMEPEFWAGIKPDVEKDWLEGLASLAQPFVEQIVKVLPVSAAQLVTGEDLTSGVAGAFTMQMIPEKYRRTPTPTGPDAPRIHLDDQSARGIVGDFTGTLIDSDDWKTEPTADPAKVYAAFHCHNTLVWGFLVKARDGGLATWHPDKVDGAELTKHAWGSRRLTDGGYVESGKTAVTGGKWYVPTAAALRSYYLYVPAGGGPGEWIWAGTTTLTGDRAADALGQPRPGGFVESIDLKPE
ncbi:hypothetical protein ACIGXM_25860 [Kitasatospora sp. NPDC052896]|uniref:hypothetical protein n=1 Tax=Kitasatospora sp. NPDC052896 TaxID=3364061 RepID=UPI0037C7B471